MLETGLYSIKLKSCYYLNTLGPKNVCPEFLIPEKKLKHLKTHSGGGFLTCFVAFFK